jgi:hypothetical protein
MHRPTLYQFFHHQLDRGFAAHGLRAPAEVDYVSDMLTRFTETRALYALRDEDDRPLEHIVDMLAAGRAAQDEGRDRARGRTVARHLAEYALFMTGLFRARLKARGQLAYYESQGRTAYWQCADYERHPHNRQLYRRLGHDFGPISDVLDHLRRVQWPLPGPNAGPQPVASESTPARPLGDILMASWWRR